MRKREVFITRVSILKSLQQILYHVVNFEMIGSGLEKEEQEAILGSARVWRLIDRAFTNCFLIGSETLTVIINLRSYLTSYLSLLSDKTIRCFQEYRSTWYSRKGTSMHTSIPIKKDGICILR